MAAAGMWQHFPFTCLSDCCIPLVTKPAASAGAHLRPGVGMNHKPQRLGFETVQLRYSEAQPPRFQKHGQVLFQLPLSMTQRLS